MQPRVTFFLFITSFRVNAFFCAFFLKNIWKNQVKKIKERGATSLFLPVFFCVEFSVVRSETLVG
jgi:hypothetical protein